MADRENKTRYRVLCWGACTDGRPCGINYPPSRRAETGDIVDDIPAQSVHWLIEGGHIELVVEDEAAGAGAGGGQ